MKMSYLDDQPFPAIPVGSLTLTVSVRFSYTYSLCEVLLHLQSLRGSLTLTVSVRFSRPVYFYALGVKCTL